MLVPTALRLVSILNVFAKARPHNDSTVTILPNYGYMFVLRTLTNSVVDVDVARTSARDGYYKLRRIIRFAAFCNKPPKSTRELILVKSNQFSRYSNGELMKYSEAGMYPLYYIDACHNVICADCANKREKLEVEERPIDVGVNYEDPEMFCQDCDKRIESAYAEDSINEVHITEGSSED